MACVPDCGNCVGDAVVAMSCACIQKGNQEFVRLTDKKRMAFCRFFMLAKQAAYAREAWCICTRFACTGTGRCPDAPGNAAKRQRYCCDSNKDIRRRRQKSTRSVLPRQWHASHARESSRKGDGFILFASAKRTKKQLLGRAKSCQWQVFVRRRPPKQGELRTDVSKATMFQGVDSVLRPRFKSPVDAVFLLK